MAGNITGNPAIATTNPATIYAMTLCEVTNLIITALIHGESSPAFLYHLASLTRRSDPVTLYNNATL